MIGQHPARVGALQPRWSPVRLKGHSQATSLTATNVRVRQQHVNHVGSLTQQIRRWAGPVGLHLRRPV